VDFDSLVPDAAAISPRRCGVSIETSDAAIVACDLATAAREHPDLLARAFGRTAAHGTKFGALARAFASDGAFIYVPADRACDEPVTIGYDAPAGTAVFPWSVVLAERGARVTVIERLGAGADAFVCGGLEIVCEDHADVTYAVMQRTAATARTIATRVANPGRDARIALAVAELGGVLAASDLQVSFDAPGAYAALVALFFPDGAQHVDVVSTVDHRAGEAASETLVKSAARERGQARFVGNIRIAPHAQGSDARLRDDALLLSPTAHIDSVPALEIGANDVKAYHGATVGAIDADQVFYMESRGIERAHAERMIALGFFEPAIERFPSASLRDELRAAVAEKLE
jgi:Fe-S cluster assembly protein SufD